MPAKMWPRVPRNALEMPQEMLRNVLETWPRVGINVLKMSSKMSKNVG